MKKTLRQLLAEPGIIMAPGCFDALTARVIQDVGFNCCYLGGYAMGSSNCLTEPLMTMSEVIKASEYVTDAIDIPLIVDAGAGFGDATQIMRAVYEFKKVGVAGIHIEDQYFPKRCHYHAGIMEVIPREDMIAKVKAAVKARGDDDFVIIARTDSRNAYNGGKEEWMERCKMLKDAGADVIMPYATCAQSKEEAREIYEYIQAPMLYVGSEGRPQYPKLSAKEIEEAGFKIVVYNAISTFYMMNTLYDNMKHLYEYGDSGFTHEEFKPVRERIERLVGLDEKYQIEKEFNQI